MPTKRKSRAKKAVPLPMFEEPPRMRLPPQYTAAQLVAVAGWFRENPNGLAVVWPGGGSAYHELDAAGWWGWFRRCLHAKINARDPGHPRGRKSGQDYQTELDRLKPFVGTRLAIRQVHHTLGERAKAAMSERFSDWY